MVWLQDPMKKMTDTSVDLYFINDRPIPFPVRKREPELCGGFYFGRNNSQSVSFINKVIQCETIKNNKEQACLKEWYRNYKVLSRYRRLQESRMDGHSVAMKLPKFQVLSAEHFPSGGYFFSKKWDIVVTRYPQLLGGGTAHLIPTVVHNNFVVGHDKKVARFKEYGLWSVNEEKLSALLQNFTFEPEVVTAEALARHWHSTRDRFHEAEISPWISKEEDHKEKALKQPTQQKGKNVVIQRKGGLTMATKMEEIEVLLEQRGKIKNNQRIKSS